jgi:hypothetical protein
MVTGPRLLGCRCIERLPGRSLHSGTQTQPIMDTIERFRCFFVASTRKSVHFNWKACLDRGRGPGGPLRPLPSPRRDSRTGRLLGWDIAWACGQRQPIPPGLAIDLLKLSPLVVTDATRHPLFAAPVAVSPLASPSDRLVASLGRGLRA